MILWSDSYLPQPSIQLSADVTPSVIRTEMDNGLARQRARFTTIRKMYKASWIFTSTQYQAFLSFHEGNLTFGVEYFKIGTSIPISTTGSLGVRFLGGAYSSKMISHNMMQVDATLEDIGYFP